jgi:hypothetical protein
MINREKYFTITILAEFDPEELKNNLIPKSEGFILTIPKKMNREVFFNEKGVPNENGSQLISSLLMDALAGNIHTAHQFGFQDSAEHFREVISRLEDLFVSNFTVKASFEDHKGWLKNKK